MFPKWRWEAVSGMTASGQELIRVERAVYYNSRGTESCQTSSTLSLLRGLMDLPFELRSPVYDHIASMPRTIDIFESDKISGGISTTDTLRQLSNAHPRFEEDIKVWLKTRPALRKLRSGEIFDATSVSFLLDFDEYFLKAICTSDTEMLKNINWTKFRNTLSHPTFNENAQRLVIDISKFHKSIDNSILGAVFPILSRYLGKLRNLQNMCVYDSHYRHYIARGSEKQDRNGERFDIWNKLRALQSCCDLSYPCTCCPTFDISYGYKRKDGSYHKSRMRPLPGSQEYHLEMRVWATHLYGLRAYLSTFLE